MIFISKHLSTDEFIATQHREVIDEQRKEWFATPAIRDNAVYLGQTFEIIRDVLSTPLHVSSGFRCATLNSLVGGRPDSRHLYGCAIDVVPVGMHPSEAMARIVRAMEQHQLPDLDQVIHEGTWIHFQVSPSREPRQMALRYVEGAYSPWMPV